MGRNRPVGPNRLGPIRHDTIRKTIGPCLDCLPDTWTSTARPIYFADQYESHRDRLDRLMPVSARTTRLTTTNFTYRFTCRPGMFRYFGRYRNIIDKLDSTRSGVRTQYIAVLSRSLSIPSRSIQLQMHHVNFWLPRLEFSHSQHLAGVFPAAPH